MDTDTAPGVVHKHACVMCARRKIRCNRRQPCGNCVAQAQLAARRGKTYRQAKSECVYVDPLPVQRHRRQDRAEAPDAEILERLRRCEELLRENNVALPVASRESRPPTRAQTVEGDSRMWITSAWEAKLVPTGPAQTMIPTMPTPSSPVEGITDEALELSEASQLSSDTAYDELNLWMSLPPELRSPTLSSVFLRPIGQNEIGREDSDIGATDPSYAATLLGMAAPTAVAHPEPRMILRLWQIFVDNVNPLMRIVHVPTTHQQVIDASWDADHAPPVTSALLFAIYTLAVMTMSPQDYATTFGAEGHDGHISRRARLQQFRAGAAQALAVAGLPTTRRFDVLQAFTLLLLGESDIDLADMMTAMAVHIGLRMGLHRDAVGAGRNSSSSNSNSNTSDVSFFEREFRLRLWWQLLRQHVTLGTHGSAVQGLNSFNCLGGGATWPTMPDPRDMRLPLNINDADLHPDMAGPPIEHAGPTEMMYLRMKYETARWMWQFIQQVHACAGTATAQAKDASIVELERLYARHYLDHCDPNIPLHALVTCMGRMAVSKMRFQTWHPRAALTAAAAAGTSDTVAFSRENADRAFRNAVRVLALCFHSRHIKRVGNSFAAFQLRADTVMHILVDAAVYVVCMLRARTRIEEDEDEDVEPDVESDVDVDKDSHLERPWRAVALFYAEYGDAIQDGQRGAGATFATALGNLTLEAWAARTAARQTQLDTPPAFIARLQQQKREREQLTPADGEGFAWAETMPLEAPYEWEMWGDFLQL